MIMMIKKVYYSTMTGDVYSTKEAAMQAETARTEEIIQHIHELRHRYKKTKAVLNRNFDRSMHRLITELKRSDLTKQIKVLED